MTAIKRKDIFGKKVFTEPQEEAEDLLKTLDLIQETLKKTAKQASEFAKGFKVVDSNDIKAFNEALSKSKKAVSDLDKFEKQRLATIEKLNFANSSRADALAEVQVQLQQQNKANKTLINQNAAIVGEYKAQSTTLVELRKRYKDLRLAEGEVTEETEELRQEIEQLEDSLKEVDAELGQFGRDFSSNIQSIKEDVGGRGREGLTTLFGFLAGAAVDSFARSRDETRRFNIVLEQIKNTAFTVGLAVIDFFNNKVLPSISVFIDQVEAEVLQLKIFANEALAFFGNDEAEKRLASQRDRLSELNQAIADGKKVRDEAADSFEGIFGRIGESNEILEEQLLLEDEIINRTIELTIQIEKLAGEQERLSAAAGDGTKSFAEQNAALEESLVIQEKRLALERELAAEQQQAAVLAIRNDLVRRNVSDQVTDQEIRTLSFIKDRELADKVSLENLERLAEANLQILAIQEDQLNFEREAGQVRREIRRDEFEKNLDFAIDAFDSIKTLREREIADTNIEFANRAEKLLQLQVLAESSFRSQAQLVRAVTDEKVNLEDLVGIEDERLLRKKLINESSLQDETILTRILDALRERRTVTRDILDAEIALTEELDEQLKESDRIFNEIEQIRKQGLIDATEDFEEDLRLRREKLIEQAEFEIALVKEQSDEEFLIREKLKNDLASLDREEAAEKERLRKDEISEVQSLANKTFQIIQEGISRRDDARSESLDNEIEQQQALINKLRQNAVEGSEKALAFEEAQLEKQRLARERAAEKAARKQRVLELAQIFLNQVAEQTKENPDTAIAEAFKNTFLAEAIAQGISGFYEGTENVAKSLGKPDVKGKDGYIIRVDGQERILNPSQNASIPSGMSNEELVKAAQEYQAGNTWSFMPKVTPVQNINNIDLSEVVASNDRVVKAIQDNKVEISNDYHGLHEWIETRIKKGQKEIIKHMLKR